MLKNLKKGLSQTNWLCYYGEQQKRYYYGNEIKRSNYYEEDIDFTKLHRIGKPALIHFHLNGNRLYAGWYYQGKLHRTDGPAEIRYMYTLSGIIPNEQWFINGQFISKRWLTENNINPYNITEKDIFKIILSF